MRVDHALDAALRIASGPLQIFFGVLEFVLVQLQARVGQLKLLGERGLADCRSQRPEAW